MLKTRNIGAYRDLLVLFTRYGRKDFRLELDPGELLLQDEPEGEIEPDVQQRPNAREQVRKDLEVFKDIAEALEEHTSFGRKMNLVGAVEQARLTLISELNYLQEAQNTEILRANLADFPAIYIPRVIHDFTT